MFHPLPYAQIRSHLEQQSSYVLFETIVPDVFRPQTVIMDHVEDVFDFYSGDSWLEYAQQLQEWQAKGYWLAVQVCYEMAYEWEEALAHLRLPGQRLMRCYAVKDPLIFDHNKGKFLGRSLSLGEPVSEAHFWLDSLQLGWKESEYAHKFAAVQNALQEGRCYQVNLTDVMHGHCEGIAESLYQSLRERQGVSYAALIKDDEDTTLCLSPELFFRVNARGKIVVRPMKGTAARSSDAKQDKQQRDYLRSDAKNVSENVMIVDLLRNDLGKVCRQGTVQVQSLCDVEAYASVWQMTSSIAGFKRKELSVWDVLKQLFPCGSVTGAPKVESMKVIGELEDQPRGIYTGAIGLVRPDGCATFNIPIRTLELKGHQVAMGVGSGVVSDSSARDEYQECLLKARFVSDACQPFELIETMRWHNGCELLEGHLNRLQASADKFSYPCDRAMVKRLVLEVGQGLEADCSHKLRLTLNHRGEIKLRTSELRVAVNTSPLALAISPYCLDQRNPFLYHKTTRRELYRCEQKRAKQEDLFDVLFFNRNGELCEGSICNVYVQKGSVMYTPSLTSGLLNGVYRQHLLQTRQDIKERTLRLDDLENADKIYVSNAVMGLREAVLREKL